jgi:hypothetical protein
MVLNILGCVVCTMFEAHSLAINMIGKTVSNSLPIPTLTFKMREKSTLFTLQQSTHTISIMSYLPFHHSLLRFSLLSPIPTAVPLPSTQAGATFLHSRQGRRPPPPPHVARQPVAASHAPVDAAVDPHRQKLPPPPTPAGLSFRRPAPCSSSPR